VAELDFRILGPLEVREGERPLPLGGAKQRAVLALLLLDAGRVVSTDRLIEELWPERPPGRPQTAIQGYVSELRKLLERKPGAPFQVLTTEGPGYRLRLEPEQLDLHRFERSFEQGQRALATGRAEVAARMLREALSLWRGPVLADFAYEAWAQAAIGRLEELRLACLEERLEADLALGRHRELIGELEALIAEHPLREHLRGQLMLALYRSGRQAEALEVYQRARRALVDELGIEPSSELQELNRLILRQEPGLVLEPLAKPPTPSLPTPATPLVGRRRELAELGVLLARREVRLLTLTGPGGSGKTRLALALCEQALPAFSDGVCFCELAPIADPALVLPSVAQALGLRESGGETPLERLTALLRERELLFCLDNLEQVVEVAPDLAELLAACPRLKLLATSRERLHLQAEHEYPVEPLPLPDPEAHLDPETLAQVDAVALFLERAQTVKPDLGLTAENAPAVAVICRKLDGLPLALELAAARLKLLSPEAMLTRLEYGLELLTGGARDLPARQQTLRATIDWSFRLLSEAEQRLFARMAVFVGGCTLAAAEQVCDGELDALQALVEKSLVRRSDGRFSMLETVREFASERLEASGEADEWQRRYADWYLDFAERHYSDLRGPEQNVWLERFEQEHANFRAVLMRAVDSGDAETAVQLAGALSRFWITRSALREGTRWLEKALRAGAAERFRARALRGLAILSIEQGDLDRGDEAAAEALALCRAVGDESGVLQSMGVLARIVTYRGDFAGAEQLYKEAADLAQRHGERLEVAINLYELGQVCRLQRRLEAAENRFRDSLTLFRELDDALGQAGALHALASVLAARGEHAQAFKLLHDAADLLAGIGYVSGLLDVLDSLAGLLAQVEEPECAARLWGAFQALGEEIGHVAAHPLDAAAHDESIASAREALGDDGFERAWTEGAAMTLDDALGYARTLAGSTPSGVV